MKIHIQPLIFIIEDDPSFRMMIKHELEKNNFRKIQYYLSVDECLPDLDQHPDIILLDGKSDIHMARINMTRIKKKSRKSDIVLLSTQNNLLAALSVMKNGASDLIVKNDQVIKKTVKSIKQLVKSKYQRQGKLADRLVAGWSLSIALGILIYFLV